MAKSHDLTDVSTWHIKANTFPSGDMFLILQERPGLNDTHIIYEVDKTEEDPYKEIASCPDKGIAILIADMLAIHANRVKAPKDNGEPLELEMLLSRVRKHSGPIKFNPVEINIEEAESNCDEAKKKYDQRVKDAHEKGTL